MGHRRPGAPGVPRATAASLPVVRGNPADRGSEGEASAMESHSPQPSDCTAESTMPPAPSPSGRQGADAALPPGPDSGPQAANPEPPPPSSSPLEADPSPGHRPSKGGIPIPLGGPVGRAGASVFPVDRPESGPCRPSNSRGLSSGDRPPSVLGDKQGRLVGKWFVAANTGNPKHPRPGEQRALGGRRKHAEQFKEEPEDAW